MKLEQIVEEIKDILLEVKGNLDLEISSICCDSRKVQKGSLFIAVKGHNLNGDDFICEAIESGAVVIATESSLTLPVATLQVKNSYEALAKIAEFFHEKPASAFDLIGVTGTNGKSSTVYILDAILKASGYCTGMIGTIINRIADREEASNLTTPDALSLQNLFSEMRDSQVKKVSLEVSSHALSQHRTGTVAFKTAVFTNLTQDHLDYHGDMENYFLAKRKLFDEFLDQSGCAIINTDDSYGEKLFKSLQNSNAFSVGKSADCDYRISSIKHGKTGSSFTLSGKAKNLDIQTSLCGDFNIYNSALAVAAAWQNGVSDESIQKALKAFSGVPGRLEMFSSSTGLRVFVDYAHTPDALEKALVSIKNLGENLYCVFGCGGDRDKSKRPLMAKAAEQHADKIWITDDNPRTEKSEAILEEIKKGFTSLENVRQQADRYSAINEAIAEMNVKDVLLVAGKGHEDYQIYGTKKTAFCDRQAVKEILGKISA